MDTLNTHTIGSLYETFAPEEAERLCLRLEIHSTPKHGSWLNMAEIELSALGRQCLDRRMGTLEDVQREVASWQHKRDQAQAPVSSDHMKWVSPLVYRNSISDTSRFDHKKGKFVSHFHHNLGVSISFCALCT